MATRFAFVFPGQGSQSIGMLTPWLEAKTILNTIFEEASDALGYDLFQLIQSGPDTVLNQTEHTQPALLATEVAQYRIWQKQTGLTPAVMAGHSLGEYSALVCAGSLSFSAALKLVALRGQLMQQAVPQGTGAMAAIIGLSNEEVVSVCEAVSNQGTVTAANYNSPGQVVIAGESAAVDAACDAAKNAGAKLAKRLPVSVPSHCALMQPAAEGLAEAVSALEIQVPTIPVIHNVDVSAHETPEGIRTALIDQLVSPVRWTETIPVLANHGAHTLVECGPGKVLTGLNKRIDKTLASVALSDAETLQALAQQFSNQSIQEEGIPS